MHDIIENAKNVKTLHPNADIDPFTKEALSPDSNIESLLRAKKTQKVVSDVNDAATEEMSNAQQDARNVVGIDSGCTHNLQNQVTARGTHVYEKKQTSALLSPTYLCASLTMLLLYI
jgi:hypothetical protein